MLILVLSAFGLPYLTHPILFCQSPTSLQIEAASCLSFYSDCGGGNGACLGSLSSRI